MFHWTLLPTLQRTAKERCVFFVTASSDIESSIVQARLEDIKQRRASLLESVRSTDEAFPFDKPERKRLACEQNCAWCALYMPPEKLVADPMIQIQRDPAGRRRVAFAPVSEYCSCYPKPHDSKGLEPLLDCFGTSAHSNGGRRPCWQERKGL